MKVVYTGPLKRVSMAPDGYSSQAKGPFAHRGEPVDVFPEVAAALVKDGPWEYYQEPVALRPSSSPVQVATTKRGKSSKSSKKGE